MEQNQRFIVSNVKGQYIFVRSSLPQNIANIPLNTNQLITLSDISVYRALLLTLDLQNNTTLTASGILDILITPTGELSTYMKIFSLAVTAGLFQTPSVTNIDILNNDFPNKLNQISIPITAISGLQIRWTNGTSGITDVLKISGNINYNTQS